MTEQQLYNLRDAKKTTGNTGEDFVLSYERQRLQGHPQLSKVAIAGRHDIGLGYDICSFEGLTSTVIDRYIEVKTYNGNPHFFLSQGEWAAANKHTTHYYIYLVDNSKVATPGYKPTIICDPAHTLVTNDNWSENIQQREFTLATQADPLPADFDASTILIGCFKDNPHLSWIRHSHRYNVRKEIVTRYIQSPHTNGSAERSHIPGAAEQSHIPGVAEQSHIPGAVVADEIGLGVRYLVLYNVCEPRSYRVYTVQGASIATNADMRKMQYPNPRCPAYVVYRLSGVVELPGIDIMRLLRTNNDKVTRTSGTPIFISGKELRQYLIDGTQQRLVGAPAPKRIFTNEGKPWSANQSQRLEVLVSMHRSIAEIAHEMKRTPAEIHTQLQVLGLE